MSHERNVLLLNMNYVPIRILSWKDAVSLVIGRGKGHPIVEYDDRKSDKFNAAVVRLAVKIPEVYHKYDKNKFSKRNVFLRDNFTCQYCAKKVVGKDLTIDHVIPRANGGKTTYMNCVAACKKCNSKKDCNSLEEANMNLIRPIKPPSRNDMFNITHVPQEWKDYLGG